MAYIHGSPLLYVNNVAIKDPSSYKWDLEDVSSSSAGRTSDFVMHKLRKVQIVKLSLEWSNIKIADAATILQAFNPEYITVKYLDAMTGDYRTSVFYVGNRSTPLYNAGLGYWSKISFDIIEKEGSTVQGDGE